MPRFGTAIGVLATCLALVGRAAAEPPVPAGLYHLDLSHSSLSFRVDHLGLSRYTARFRRFEGTLEFDPRSLVQSKLEVIVDVRSIETDFPDPARVDFNAMLLGTDWLDGAQHPQMIYRSKRVTPTDDGGFVVEGELTLHGVPGPVALTGRYNGGYATSALEPRARIGFSAHGRLRRSDFGVTTALPPTGSRMGVGDEVEIVIETEFSGPPLPPQPPPPGSTAR